MSLARPHNDDRPCSLLSNIGLLWPNQPLLKRIESAVVRVATLLRSIRIAAVELRGPSGPDDVSWRKPGYLTMLSSILVGLIAATAMASVATAGPLEDGTAAF